MRLCVQAVPTASQRMLFGALPLAAFLLLCRPVSAQDQLVVSFDDRRGWLGLEIRFEIEEAPGPPASRSEVLVIAGVIPDSPAEGAGVQAGDILVEIDGAPASRQELRRLERELDVGTPVDLSLDRAGEALSLTLEADEPPSDLRRRIVTVRRLVRGNAGDGSFDIRVDLDSLRAEVEAISLDRLQEVRLRVDSIRALSEERMAEVRESLERSREGLEAVFWPMVWGQGVVAGAELTELNPSLGRYFGVDEGVLVTDVTAGSPAAEGGVEPGDVIVEVDGEEVTSVRDVRGLFSRLSFGRTRRTNRDAPGRSGIPITVVREGERLELIMLR